MSFLKYRIIPCQSWFIPWNSKLAHWKVFLFTFQRLNISKWKLYFYILIFINRSNHFFLNKLMSFIIVGTNTCNKSFLGNSRKFLYSINTTKICIFIPIRINMFCNLINPAACESENDETMLMYETFMNLKIMWSIKNRHYYL